MEIVDHPKYLIYPDGRVWSNKSNRFMKGSKKSTGYRHVYLDDKKSINVHRLVAIHYIPNPDNKPCVDHINRERDDNRIENLRWATSSENSQNQSLHKDNKSGYKNIYYDRTIIRWVFQKMINGRKTQKTFHTLHDTLVFKLAFIILNPVRF